MANNTVVRQQRDDLYDLTVTVFDGNYSTNSRSWTGVFDKMSGGAVTAKSDKYRPANGTVQEVAPGGAQTIADVKVTRMMESSLEGVLSGTSTPIKKWLAHQVGRAGVTVIRQPLDANGAAYGSAETYKGILDGFTPPEPDSSSSKQSVFELDVTAVSLS